MCYTWLCFSTQNVKNIEFLRSIQTLNNSLIPKTILQEEGRGVRQPWSYQPTQGNCGP